MRKLNKYKVSPEYQRIPHFNKEISNMTHDDIQYYFFISLITLSTVSNAPLTHPCF